MNYCRQCAGSFAHSSWCPEVAPAVLGSWIDEGLCAGLDMFAKGYAATQAEVCNACPVQRHCAEYAIEAGIDDGIWGLVPELRRQVKSGFKSLDEVLP